MLEVAAGRLNAMDWVVIDRDRALRKEALGLTDKSRRAAGRRAEYLMKDRRVSNAMQWLYKDKN